MTQKLLDMKTEENKAMARKMKDLEDRLMKAQSKSSKQPSQSSEMTAKLHAAERKIEEYKRLNQRLMDSMNQPKEKSDSQEMQDMRRKLELLDRQYNESKKNLEKQTFRMREIQDSERKLKADLQRTIDENRKLRQNPKKDAA